MRGKEAAPGEKKEAARSTPVLSYKYGSFARAGLRAKLNQDLFHAAHLEVAIVY